jgi:hypothetical protein
VCCIPIAILGEFCQMTQANEPKFDLCFFAIEKDKRSHNGVDFAQ